MSWSTVATGNGGGPGAATSTAATASSSISVGDLLVAGISRSSLSDDFASDTCADSLGNTYTSLGHTWDSVNHQGVSWFYSVATTGGTPTVTITHPSHSDRGMVLGVYHATAGAIALDVAGTMQTSTTASASADNVTCTSVTPGLDNDLLVAFMANDSNASTTFAAGTGFAVDTQNTNSASYTAIESKSLGATHGVAQSATGSDPNSGARVINGAAVFKAATYFGNATPSQTRTATADQANIANFQNTAGSGNIITGRMYLAGGASNANIRFVVYTCLSSADNDPTGQTLLGYSDTVVLPSGAAAGFVDFNFSTPVAVVNNTWYGIGIQTNVTVTFYCGALGGFWTASDTFADGPAATWSTLGSQSGAVRQPSFQAGVVAAAAGSTSHSRSLLGVGA